MSRLSFHCAFDHGIDVYSIVKGFGLQAERPVLVLRMVEDRKQIHALNGRDAFQEVRHALKLGFHGVFSGHKRDPNPHWRADASERANVGEGVFVSDAAEPAVKRGIDRLEVDEKEIAEFRGAEDA